MVFLGLFRGESLIVEREGGKWVCLIFLSPGFLFILAIQAISMSLRPCYPMSARAKATRLSFWARISLRVLCNNLTGDRLRRFLKRSVG